jgi:hypothetical protein
MLFYLIVRLKFGLVEFCPIFVIALGLAFAIILLGQNICTRVGSWATRMSIISLHMR